MAHASYLRSPFVCIKLNHNIIHNYHCINLISPIAICLTDWGLTSLPCLKIFPPCCLEWRLRSGNALALRTTLPLSPGTLCGGIWQACGWSPAWSCISSSFSNGRLSSACPLPVTQGLSIEVRRWPWPCTSAAPLRPHCSRAVVVSVQFMSQIPKHERSSSASALMRWLFPVPHR